MIFKLFYLIIFIFSYSLKANEITEIELHTPKTLDQLVLEKEIEINDYEVEENLEQLEENNEIEITNTSDEILSNDNKEVSLTIVNVENETNIENINPQEVTLISVEKIC